MPDREGAPPFANLLTERTETALGAARRIATKQEFAGPAAMFRRTPNGTGKAAQARPAELL